MKTPTVVVLGGGMSGLAAAHTLALGGCREVTVVEQGDAVGGLARSFTRDRRVYPLGYHHILRRDRALWHYLDIIGASGDVRWRRIRMLFHGDRRFYNLASVSGRLAFPMTWRGKLHFARLMLRASRKADWSDWLERTAAELVDAWADTEVRQTIFEPLTRLRFELPCAEISGAWLGLRLHYREGSLPLGYIPGTNWTARLCEGLADLLENLGVRVLLNRPVVKLHTAGQRVVAAELADGSRLHGDVFVSTVPTEVYLRLVPDDRTPALSDIRYTAMISVVCATRQPIVPRFYWLNLTTGRQSACGVFLLDGLNPTLGHPGEHYVNFVTHLRGRDRMIFQAPDDELLAAYRRDFNTLFGTHLDPVWTQIVRLPMYAPIFVTGYRNPPLRSTHWSNVYFAGNYRTHPSVASTGTALASGVESGQAILREHARRT